MAGENTLPNEHYPDYFEVVSFPFYHAMVKSTTNTLPLMYVEARATNGTGIVVDSITFGVNVVETAADTAQIISAATPQATSGTALHATACALDALGTTTVTVDPANNFVPAGNWLLLKASDSLGQVHGSVTIRFRSRLK